MKGDEKGAIVRASSKSLAVQGPNELASRGLRDLRDAELASTGHESSTNSVQEAKGNIFVVYQHQSSPRNIASGLLTLMGYESMAFVGGPATLAALKSGTNCNLLFLDFESPSPDGIAILKELKEQFPRLAVAVVVGLRDDSTQQILIRMGAYEYLLDSAELKNESDVVRHVFEGRQSKVNNPLNVGGKVEGEAPVKKPKLISEMTEQEVTELLLYERYTSSLTGLPNDRAFREEEEFHGPSPRVAVCSVDWVEFRGDSRSKLVLATAAALCEAQLEPYHSYPAMCERFWFRGNSTEALRSKLEKARRVLRDKKTEINNYYPIGTCAVAGVDFSYGIGENVKEAEAAETAYRTAAWKRISEKRDRFRLFICS